jgi:hypothetical protein
MDGTNASRASTQHPDFAVRGITTCFLRNPRYQPGLPPADLRSGNHAPFPLPDRHHLLGLLRALAFAKGAGLPRRDVWLAVANGLRRSACDRQEAYAAGHLNEVFTLPVLRSQLVEDGEDGQTVYRLHDEALAARLRATGPGARAGHRDIVDVLIASTTCEGRPYWPAANPYTLRHLASHAAECGRLDELVTDPLYLVAAVPDALHRELTDHRPDLALGSRAREAARVYVEVAAAPDAELRLTPGSHADNAALLELGARLHGAGSLADRIMQLALPGRAGATEACQDVLRRLPALVALDHGSAARHPPGRLADGRSTSGHLADCAVCAVAFERLRAAALAHDPVRAAWREVATAQGVSHEFREGLRAVVGAAGAFFERLPAVPGLLACPEPLMLGEPVGAADDPGAAPAEIPAVRVTLPDRVTWVDLRPSADGRALDVLVDSREPGSAAFSAHDAAGGLIAMVPPKPCPACARFSVPPWGTHGACAAVTVEIVLQRAGDPTATVSRIHLNVSPSDAQQSEGRPEGDHARPRPRL